MPECKNITFRIKTSIKNKGWPTDSSRYRTAHSSANRAEKKEFGKRAFNAVQKIANRLPPDELMGTHTRSGRISVSKSVPGKYRCQVAYHEQIEHRTMIKHAKAKGN